MIRHAFGLVLLLSMSLTLFAQRRNEAWIDRTLKSMTVDEKVGQLLVPVVRSGFRNVESEDFAKLRRNIVDFKVGGYHVVGTDPAGLAVLINDMQRIAKVPLMITADLEGGTGYVIPFATRFPLAMAMGATGSEQLAYEAAKATATEARAVGINVDFYPVADVQNNPANPIINIRSFGEDPAKVSSLVAAYVKGIQESGVMATAKHFPGHGDVGSDSHLELPVLDVTRERLDAIELRPFKAAMEAGVGAVMTAHIYLPALDSEKGLPATLSHNVLTGLLREQMGFKGLLFTDALDMAGVAKHYSIEESAVKSIEAGADVLLFPIDVERSFNGVKSAVESGRIPMSRLDDAVRRILRAKLTLGLDKYRPATIEKLSTTVGSGTNRALAQKIADSAITLVRDERNIVPLKIQPEQRLLHITMLDSRIGWREGTPGPTLAAELPKRFPNTTTVQLDDQSIRNEYEMVRGMANMVDAILVTAFIRVAAYKGSIDLKPEQIRMLRDLSAMKKPFIFVLFGSPYLLHHVPELPSYMLTYDVHPGAEIAAVKAIAGEIPIQGKLPISLPGLYPVGHGLTR